MGGRGESARGVLSALVGWVVCIAQTHYWGCLRHTHSADRRPPNPSSPPNSPSPSLILFLLLRRTTSTVFPNDPPRSASPRDCLVRLWAQRGREERGERGSYRRECGAEKEGERPSRNTPRPHTTHSARPLSTAAPRRPSPPASLPPGQLLLLAPRPAPRRPPPPHPPPPPPPPLRP